MGQNRVFYACQAVGIGAPNQEKYVEGVQSVGINTTFDFEQAFELGVLTIYENMEGVPSVEVTMERNLVSGVHPLWYSIAKRDNLLATNKENEPGAYVVAIGETRPSVVLQVFKENTVVGGDADETFYVRTSGVYLSNYSVNVGVDGPATESLTFVGNDYSWSTGDSGGVSGIPSSPTSLGASGINFKREHLKKSSDLAWVPSDSIISGSGLQSISVSIDFGREDIFELGSKVPYYKSATFPVEVTTEIEYIETNTAATSTHRNSDFKANQTSDVTTRKPLGFVLGNMGFFMGSGNRLTGTNTTGGDAGGGNQTVTFSYQTFNELAGKGTGSHYNRNNNGGAGGA